MKSYQFLLSIFAVVMSFAVAQAANPPVIDVNVQGVARQSLTLAGVNAGGAGGQTFFKTLQNDLQRCGWYRLAANAAEISALIWAQNA